MNRFPSLMVAVFFLAAGTVSQTAIAGQMDLGKLPPAKSQRSSSMVQGEVTKIDGEFYTVKDQAGKEVRLHVDTRTSMIGNITQGTKIQAEVEKDGRTTLLKAVK